MPSISRHRIPQLPKRPRTNGRIRKSRPRSPLHLAIEAVRIAAVLVTGAATTATGAAARVTPPTAAISAARRDELVTLPADMAGARVGAGWDDYAGTLRVACVAYGDAGDLAVPLGYPAVGVGRARFALDEVEGRDALADLLKLDVKAAAGFGPFKASARVDLFRRSTQDTYSYNLVVRSEVAAPPTELKSLRLTPEAAAAAKKGASAFYDMCGNQFVIGFNRGAGLLGVVSLKSTTSTQYRNLVTAVRGKATGVFSAAADLQTQLSSITSGRAHTVVFEKDGALDQNPDLNRLTARALEVERDVAAGNYVNTGWRLASYNQVPGVPHAALQAHLATTAAGANRLDRLAREQVVARAREAVIMRASDFPAEFDLAGYDVAAAARDVAARLAALDGAVTKCAAAPSSCPDVATIRPALAGAPPDLRPVRAFHQVIHPSTPTPQLVGVVPSDETARLTVSGLWTMYPPPRPICRLVGTHRVCTPGREEWRGPLGYAHAKERTPLLPDARHLLGSVVIEIRDANDVVVRRQVYAPDAEGGMTVSGGQRVYAAMNLRAWEYKHARQNQTNPMTATLQTVP